MDFSFGDRFALTGVGRQTKKTRFCSHLTDEYLRKEPHRVRKTFVLWFSAFVLTCLPLSQLAAQELSVHQQQMLELEANPQPPTEDELAVKMLEAEGKLHPLLEAKGVEKSATPAIGNDFIVFGYAQSESQILHTRWEALTHVGSLFVTFNSSGALTNAGGSAWATRSSYLRAGGAAQAAGVKVIMVVLNSGFDVNVINTVMTTPAARTNLVNQIDAAVTGDSYAHGVSFDFEPFSWSASARAGMVIFFQELRAALPPPYEISIYADPSPGSNQWDLPAFTPNLDYYLYSCYDYATGTTPHAISDFNNYITSINSFYLDGGVPPSKFVAVISSYSGRWGGVTAYNQSGGSSRVAAGFTDGLYETTLWPQFGGPKTENYVTGDEVSWHTWLDTGTSTNYVRTWDSPRALEMKIRSAVSNYGPTAGNLNNGKRLRGVGFWSLMWLAETTSWNMNAFDGATGSVSRTRTYPQVYQLCQEILKRPGTTRFPITGFEGSDPRWRDPNNNADAVNLNGAATNAIVTAPAGAGRPPSTTNAMQVTFNFAAGATQRCFFQHEILADTRGTSVPDMNAPAAVFESNTALNAYIYTPAAYSGRTIRMVVADANRQLEMSPTFTLNASGWRQINWNLTDPAQILAFDTADVRFVDGNGVLNTAGGGKKDIGFIGFLIEGGGTGSGNVVIDELTYEHANPGGRNYKINEFRYNSATAEFVEIHGPVGAFPAGTELRFYSGTTGAVLSSVSLASQSIPASGLFVVGDTGVTNVNLVPAGWGAADNMVNTNPGSIQIYNTSTGNVYDSAVYLAFGGARDLNRQETRGVAGEGYPWIGEVASGTANYTMGRYPDGADTEVNGNDFTFMLATPGTANGGKITSSVNYNFTSAPATAFSTFQTFTVGASGVGASPSGGNVHRCVDTTGGGQISVFGDAALGSGGTGYTVTGEIFIPNGAAPQQAIGVGICGRQGSNFFTANPAASGYESGYWLIFENAAGVGLNDGRPDHADTFEFVHATNDNMDATPVALLGSATRAATGAAAGAWTTFYLSVDPAGNNLTARINGVNVYNGAIPAGGPTSGAFQVGFRENHAGAPAAVEGTWIDNLTITTGPARVGFILD